MSAMEFGNSIFNKYHQEYTQHNSHDDAQSSVVEFIDEHLESMGLDNQDGWLLTLSPEDVDIAMRAIAKNMVDFYNEKNIDCEDFLAPLHTWLSGIADEAACNTSYDFSATVDYIETDLPELISC